MFSLKCTCLQKEVSSFQGVQEKQFCTILFTPAQDGFFGKGSAAVEILEAHSGTDTNSKPCLLANTYSM